MWKKFFVQFLAQERGIQHAEEALLLALITLSSLVAVSQVGTSITGFFKMVVEKWPA